jgi:hypothetical protein
LDIRSSTFQDFSKVTRTNLPHEMDDLPDIANFAGAAKMLPNAGDRPRRALGEDGLIGA